MTEHRKDTVWRKFGEALAAQGVKLEDVINAGEEALSETLDELRFTGLDRALILSRLALERPRTTGKDALQMYFETAEQRTLEPWRILQQRLEKERAAVEALSVDQQRAQFIALAKDRALT